MPSLVTMPLTVSAPMTSVRLVPSTVPDTAVAPGAVTVPSSCSVARRRVPVNRWSGVSVISIKAALVPSWKTYAPEIEWSPHPASRASSASVIKLNRNVIEVESRTTARYAFIASLDSLLAATNSGNEAGRHFGIDRPSNPGDTPDRKGYCQP